MIFSLWIYELTKFTKDQDTHLMFFVMNMIDKLRAKYDET